MAQLSASSEADGTILIRTSISNFQVLVLLLLWWFLNEYLILIKISSSPKNSMTKVFIVSVVKFSQAIQYEGSR